MIAGIFEKTPNEKVPLTLDLTNYLPSGETIQNTSTVTVKDADGKDVNATLLHAISILSPHITAVLKAGTSGQKYSVTFSIISENYTFEEEVRLVVRAN